MTKNTFLCSVQAVAEKRLYCGCIAGLIEPDSGEIYIGDKRIDNVPPEDRDIGFVFQTFALFPHMTAWGNVLYGPKVKNYDAETS